MENEQHRFAHNAMGAVFEVVVAGGDVKYAGEASMAAFADVDVIEKQLSRFIESSDISQINHAKPDQWIRVGSHTFDCIKAAAQAYADTDGAFDVTIGPLMKCWRTPEGDPRQPSPGELAKARAHVGMRLLELNETDRTVRVKVEGVQLDLGGIGKGYAVDRIVDGLKEWGIQSAFVNGGDSTVYGLGRPPGKDGWPAGVGGVGNEPEPRYTIALRDMSLSGSAIHGRGRHIMDPKTGQPSMGKVAAWSLCPNATTADALSTAFFVMPPEQVEQYCVKHPDTCGMIAMADAGGNRLLRYGKWPIP